MRILIAEYATAENLREFLYEGFAMLHTLVSSFERIGCEVCYLTREILMNCGVPVFIQSFEKGIEEFSREVDGTLLIAPDEILGDLTERISSENLGSPADSVRICADKLRCYEKLEDEGIKTPFSCSSELYVIKPRFGCGCQKTFLSSTPVFSEELISTPFIRGEHISVSAIGGEFPRALSANKQFIVFEEGGKVRYDGNRTPVKVPEDVLELAVRCGEILGLRGYYGVDMVLGEEPFVVDVNPRVTTSIFSLSRVMREEIAEEILNERLSCTIEGSFEFRIRDLKRFFFENSFKKVL
ncbi:MAG: ATP-grasp domain-containing protein [Archaeoglobi archaeon]|nr:ATP-grasp domain-containing protein [Candidatus Mnemosynella bozhongmuii]